MIRTLLVCISLWLSLAVPSPAEAGLFGPSKKEIMLRMEAASRERAARLEAQMGAHLNEARMTNDTLHRMEVSQARQEELLRQIAGSSERAANSSERAAVGSERAAEEFKGFKMNLEGPYTRMKPDAFQEAPGKPNMQQNSFQTPPGQSNMAPGSLQAPPGQPNVPAGGFQTPPADLERIQGARAPTSNFASQRRAVPIKTVSWSRIASSPTRR